MKHIKICILKIWCDGIKFGALLEMKPHQIWCFGVLLEMVLRVFSNLIQINYLMLTLSPM